MTDKELLELAAKAAGIPLEFRMLVWSEGIEYPCYADTESVSATSGHEPVIRWNPLEDDAQALRLAVKLQLEVAIHETYSGVINGNLVGGQVQHGNDPYAAARRAIVRAAAEIGKAMT